MIPLDNNLRQANPLVFVNTPQEGASSANANW
ncbi:Uncharacterised protein [Vibrio cholerae]|nr:Uncharacterised protein [Vibrio cholerae]